MKNVDYFTYSIKHPDGLIDPLYFSYVERILIPETKYAENDLTRSNNNVVEYITTIKNLIKVSKMSIDDETILVYLKKIIEEIEKENMNLTPFCQYFMVHNITNSIFDDLEENEKISVLKYLVSNYIENRHDMYLSHGYSNTAIQVMSDNYCHKRKGAYGAYKIAKEVNKIGIKNYLDIKGANIDTELYCLLADKDGKTIFKEFADFYGIVLNDEGKKTEKYPDAFIRIGEDFFIVEHKQMKEGGGDQDKTIKDVIEFISKEPEFKNLHYVSYVDGVYLKMFETLGTKKAITKTEKKKETKILTQYADIVDELAKHKESNYFVNSNGFKKLINDYYTDYMLKKIVK